MADRELRVPQVRVLRALARGAVLSRPALGERAGYTAISGTITRALNGLREGSSSGPAHPGLLAMGYIEEIVVPLDGGVTELCYRITPAGREALEVLDGEPPDLRPREACINKRYKEPEQ